MTDVVPFLSSNIWFLASTLLVAVAFWIPSRGNKPANAIAAIVVAAVLTTLLRALWAVGSSPKVAADFVKSDFLLAVAALFTAGATVALWIVTLGLKRVSAVQVHAATAPLITVLTFIRHDPPATQEEEQVFLPAYTFEEQDRSVVEINAFHNEFDALFVEYSKQMESRKPSATGSMPPAPKPPSRAYVVVRIFNAQAQSSYGLATDIEIDTVLTFPRYSAVKGANPSATFNKDQLYELPRKLNVALLAGQGYFAIAAFRVDQLPVWGMRIDAIRHKNMRGKLGTYAVGSKSVLFGPAGFQPTMGAWPACPGEQPK